MVNKHDVLKMVSPKLWSFQREAVALALCKEEGFAFFLEMGLGKTKSACEVIRLFGRVRNVDTPRFVIFCPLAVMNHWREELLDVIGESIYREILILDDPSKSKRLATKHGQSARIIIINHDKLSRESGKKLLASLGDIDCVVVDESHKYKTHNSNRTKTMMRFLSKHSPFTLILTGSPVLQNVMDLWAQLYLVSPNILGKNFYSFRGRFCYDANAGWKDRPTHFTNWQVKPGAEALLAATISPYSFTRTKEDVGLELPDVLKIEEHVSMGKEQARLYKQMRKTFVAWLKEEGELNKADYSKAKLVLEKTLRLQEIASGFLRTEDGSVNLLPNGKITRLRELLEEIDPIYSGHKVIIWTCRAPTYKPIYEVCEKLGLNPVFLTGEQNSSEKKESIAAFRDDPSCSVIICNQRAGGTGVDGLQKSGAAYMIYYSKGFALEDDLQSQARLLRSGVTASSVTRIDLLTEGSVDLEIHDALINKRKPGETVQALVKAFRDE